MENTSIDNLFKSLEQSIQAGELDQALNLLDANKQKFDAGVFHFNRGTLLARKEDLLGARIEFELAQQQGYVSPELRLNLGRVKQALNVSEAEKPDGLLDYLYYGHMSLPLDIYVTAALLLLTAIVFGLKGISIKVKCALSLVLILPAAWGWYHFSKTSVIILKSEQIVREGPSKIFHETQVAPKGVKLLVGKTFTDYVEVLYPKVYRGWIEKTDQFSLRD